LTKTHT